MIFYRSCDSRFPFLWEDTRQPAGRWNAGSDGPVQYLADTPHGAWAEFIRHEEITDEADLAGINRSLWAVDLAPGDLAEPDLEEATLLGGEDTYPECRREAVRLRTSGAAGICAPSAALLPGSAAGQRVDRGIVEGPARDGQVIALFGTRPDAVGWQAAEAGRPPRTLLPLVRPL